MKKKLITLALLSTLILGACTEADTVSENLSKEADSFKIQRRIVFVNGITDKYLLTVEGLCSLGNFDSDLRMSVTCKIGEDEFVKHHLGLSDNVTFVSEQINSADVDPFHYKLIFRPEAIIPDIDLQTSKE